MSPIDFALPPAVKVIPDGLLSPGMVEPYTQLGHEPEVFHATEHNNRCRWQPGERGHYEVWYLTFNHRETGAGFWIRYTIESPGETAGEPYAQLWFAYFDPHDTTKSFAINKKHPIARFHSDASPFRVSLADAELHHAGAKGALEGADHKVQWDLSWLPYHQSHYHLPRVMYRSGGLGDTTVLSPNVDIPISGTIHIDGRELKFSEAPGGQTHLWGRKHAHKWAWGHCNAFEGHRGAVLEALTVRLKKRGVVTPPMSLISLYYQGEAFRFTEFHDVALFTRASYEGSHYHFSARGPRTRIEGSFECAIDDMVRAQYEDPDGELAWCCNTEIANLRVRLYQRSGPLLKWRERVHLVAPGRGHFEIGQRSQDLRVVREHVLID